MNEDSFGSHDRYYSTITSNVSKFHLLSGLFYIIFFYVIRFMFLLLFKLNKIIIIYAEMSCLGK